MADGDAYGPAMVGLIGAVVVALLTSVVTSLLTLTTIRSERSNSVRVSTYADRKHTYLKAIDDLSAFQLPGGLADHVPLVAYVGSGIPPILAKALDPKGSPQSRPARFT